MTEAVGAPDRWLTAPAPPHALAHLRAGLAAVILLRIATGPYAEVAGQPAALFDPPLLLSWLPSMPGGAALIALQVVGALAATATLVARRHRVASFAVAWTCLLVLAGLRGSLGKVLHNDVLLLLAAVPVVVAPDPRDRQHDDRPSARWGWPVRGAAVVTVLVYFVAGVQKLRHSGLEWVTGDNMRWILSWGIADGRAATDAVARAVAERPWLAHVLAAGLLATELVAPLTLAVRRARVPWVAAAVALHLGTWLTLGLDYWAWALTVVVVIAALQQADEAHATNEAHDTPTPRPPGVAGVEMPPDRARLAPAATEGPADGVPAKRGVGGRRRGGVTDREPSSGNSGPWRGPYSHSMVPGGFDVTS